MPRQMVARKFRRWRPVRESRRIVHIGRRVGMPRQVVLSPDVQRVPLIVIQQPKSIAKRKVGQPAINIPKPKCQLVRIRQINLCPIPNPWRTQCQLPPIDPRALNCHRKKQVRIVEVVMVEKILCPRQKIIRVKRPAMKGNRHAELMLFVALSVKRNKSQILVGSRVQKRSRKRKQRRRLIKMPVKRPENPVQLRNPQRSADAWTRRILNYIPRKMRLPQPAIQSEPRSHLELILGVHSGQAAHRIRLRRSQIRRARFRTTHRRRRRTIKNQAEELRVLLRKRIKTRAQVILFLYPRNRRLPALILRRAVLRRRTRQIQWTTFIVRAVEMEKRRNREH